MFCAGQLTDVLNQSRPEFNLTATEIPDDEADELEVEIHSLFVGGLARGVPDLVVACSIAQAAYVLGLRHGVERAFRAAEQLTNLTPADFDDEERP